MPALEARQAPEHVQAQREVHVAEQGRRHHQVRETLKRFACDGREHDDDGDDTNNEGGNKRESERLERCRRMGNRTASIAGGGEG